MSKVARFHIGVDLHKTVIQVCVRNDLGEIVEERRHLARDLAAGRAVIDDLKRYRASGRFAVEAIGVNRWFVNRMLSEGFDIVVCDPAKLNLRMLGRKTDRRDAQEIARRLQLGDIDRCAVTYYPSDEQYGRRKVLRVRHKLIEGRQQVVNQLRSLLNAYKVTGIGDSLLSQRAQRDLRRVAWPTEEMGAVVETLLASLAGLSESIRQLDRQIRESARHTSIPELVDQLPWAGPLTVSTLSYELGDVSRFRHTRAVAAYAGLVPRVSQSGDTAHHGRLTKRGNRELRHVLGEWAVRLLGHDRLVQRWAEPRLARMHKNKVRMALSRRLLIGVYKMLRTGEPFSLERCLGLQS